MPKAKKKLLPKDIDVLMKAGDIAALKAVFDACELDARGGYGKQTALAFYDCPDELATWLVQQGADIDARDSYGRTPLQNRAVMRNGRIDVLLDLGANIHATDSNGDTPLHAAAKFGNVEAVRALLARGARADALNYMKLTPLAAGLQQCSNAAIKATASIAELLLPANAPPEKGFGSLLKRAFSGGPRRHQPSPQLQGFVQRIGEDFEFHRAGFNPDYLAETDAALHRLYELFNVPPVPRRLIHDGREPIIVQPGNWPDQHEALWALLVPSSGAASTVQGEVIRISGRVADEIERNGGVNWDAHYGKMTRAFLAHIGSGSPLPENERSRAARLVAEVRKSDGAPAELCELAVQWVKLNPVPVSLGPPDYSR